MVEVWPFIWWRTRNFTIEEVKVDSFFVRPSLVGFLLSIDYEIHWQSYITFNLLFYSFFVQYFGRSFKESSLSTWLIMNWWNLTLLWGIFIFMYLLKYNREQLWERVTNSVKLFENRASSSGRKFLYYTTVHYTCHMMDYGHRPVTIAHL